jgi:predicted ArsR family transcriptional regulator
LFVWFIPNRNDWLEGRKTRREEKTDAKVLGAIRVLCEGNSGIYKTEDIAERLGVSLDAAADSLERLENIGRVQSYDIGTTDSPGPGWRSKFR